MKYRHSDRQHRLCGAPYAASLLKMPLRDALFLLSVAKYANVGIESEGGITLPAASGYSLWSEDEEEAIIITPKIMRELAAALHGERGAKFKLMVLEDMARSVSDSIQDSLGIAFCYEEGVTTALADGGERLCRFNNASITLRIGFVVWARAICDGVDMGRMIRRARSRCGTAFFQLWLFMADAKAEMARDVGRRSFSATFYFSDIERPKREGEPIPPRDRVANSAARRNLIEVADEVAAFVGANTWRVVSGQEKSDGIEFRWRNR